MAYTLEDLEREMKLQYLIRDSEGYTRFHRSVVNNNFEMLRRIGETIPESVYDCRNDGFSAFQHAIHNNRHNMVRYMIEKSPEIVNRKFRYGVTGICEACLPGRLSDIGMLTLLLNSNSDWTIERNNGYTAFHAACQSGNVEFVKYFIDSEGADVNRKSQKTGRTPLHAASTGGNVEVCKFLISRGADLSVKDNNGSLAMGVAKNTDIEDFLKEEFVKKMNEKKE